MCAAVAAAFAIITAVGVASQRTGNWFAIAKARRARAAHTAQISTLSAAFFSKCG